VLKAHYYHALFAVSAAWNLIAALTLLLKPEVLLARLNIDDPGARILAQSFVSSVATWGIGYALIAYDPVRFRDFAWLGMFSKTIYFAVYAHAFAKGRISRSVFFPAILDLILAALFLEFLINDGGGR
jgi:hypothetical protein